MPTLFVIDADSTQACPAALAVLNAQRRADDRFLLLGGTPMREAARRAGIAGDAAVLLPPPPRQTPLGFSALKNWLQTQDEFKHVCCGSVPALRSAARWLPCFSRAQVLLTLFHTPGENDCRRLLRHTRRSVLSIRVATDALKNRLVVLGVSEASVVVQPPTLDTSWIKPGERGVWRKRWGIQGDRRQVVALLSDHPGMVNAIDGAAVTCMAGGTLTDESGDDVGLTLLAHPDQMNRLRAQDFLDQQGGRHRVVQEPAMAEPWCVLPGCDAALALGPDAGGISAFWAQQAGVPIIAPPTELTHEIAAGSDKTHIARADLHKDLAHELHSVIIDPAMVRG